MSDGNPIWMVTDGAQKYRVNLITNSAEVLKVRRNNCGNTEYFQKITSRPKLKRLLRKAAEREQAWQAAT